MFNNKYFFTGRYLVCAVLLCAFLFNGEAVFPTPSSSGLGMEVEFLDAGLRRLPDNQFIKGEKIILMIRILDYQAQDETARADNLYVQNLKADIDGESFDSNGDKSSQPSRSIFLGSTENPWHQSVQFSWSGDNGKGSLEDLKWIPSERNNGLANEYLKNKAEEYWVLETGSLSPGNSKLIAQIQMPETDASGQVIILEGSAEFTLLDQGEVPSSELARVKLHESRAALDAEQYDLAINKANEAIEYGPADYFDLATLQTFLGTAYENMGDLKNALEAYKEAKKIAEEHFPGRSSLPSIMESNMVRLSRIIDDEK